MSASVCIWISMVVVSGRVTSATNTDAKKRIGAQGSRELGERGAARGF